MANNSLSFSPIDIIAQQTEARNELDKNSFMGVVRDLYQYPIFKDIMDFITTKTTEKTLSFLIQNQQGFMLTEGHCHTTEERAFDKLMGVFRKKRSYRIRINKINAEVLIHEVAHMLEKDCVLDLKPFMQAIGQDLRAANPGNIQLRSALKQVFKTEVEAYPSSAKASELFARYFQVFAMAREVAGYTSYHFSLDEIGACFPETNAWMLRSFHTIMLNKINKAISAQSEGYMKPMETLLNKSWSKTVDSSFTRSASASTSDNQSKWRSKIPSNKD